jgi:hypothetical protein
MSLFCLGLLQILYVSNQRVHYSGDASRNGSFCLIHHKSPVAWHSW